MKDQAGGAPPQDRLGDLQVEYRSPDSIRPDPSNPRVHPKPLLDGVKASMLAFGFTNPILADETGTVICGHGRLRCAKELGLKLVPVIVLRGLSEVERRALRIADNKIPSKSSWDADLLRSELLAIATPELNFDLSLTGFSAGEINVVLGAGAAADPDDEVVPAAPLQPVTRRGDIWRAGPHRLACGDARDRAALAALIDGPADAAFLDPPYNCAVDGNAVGKGRHKNFAMAVGEMTPAQFIAFLVASLGVCASVSRDGAVHFVCMDHHHVGELAAAGDAVYGERLNIAVWRKSNAGMGGLYRSQHELVFVFKVGDGPYLNTVELGKHGRNRTNCWDYPSVNSFKGARRHDLALHPTVKPIQLVADAILDVTRRGDRVLDAFLGSGTSLLAAERTGRRCFGLEYEPAYVDLALERWSALTGDEPVLEATGASFAAVRALRSSGGETDV